MSIITQKISNDKNFKEVEREINIEYFSITSPIKVIDIGYTITKYIDGEDVSEKFNPNVPTWTINNSQLMLIRDENFKPTPNPYYIKELDENGDVINFGDVNLRLPAYDYILDLMLEKNIPLKALLQMYIIEEDSEGRFD